MKSDRRTLQIARHEAAHAFVAEYLGVRVTRAVLAPPRTKNRGYVCYDRRRRVGKLRRAIIAMAGTVAEQRWHRVRRFLVSSADYKEIARSFHDSDLGYIRYLARVYVSIGVKEIDAMARELRKRDLSGAEVRRIFKRARPGRWRE